MNTNAELSSLFREMADYRKESPYARKAFLKTADEIAKLDFDISLSNIADLDRVKGMSKGSKSNTYIREYLRTGSIAELEQLRKQYVGIFDFTNILGIGPKFAAKLRALGYTSFEQLYQDYNEGAISLTDMQAFGLTYYDDLLLRIPRSEVRSQGSKVIEVAQSLDNQLVMNIVGSYRRKATSSGDIDILMAHPEDVNVLGKLVRALKRQKLIYKTLSLGETKFMGAYKNQNGNMRKIDIRFVPYSSYWAALMHSTGSDKFNVAMRQKAESMGMKLSEYGLLDLSTDVYLPVQSEHDIFTHLNEEYVPPSQR